MVSVCISVTLAQPSRVQRKRERKVMLMVLRHIPKKETHAKTSTRKKKEKQSHVVHTNFGVCACVRVCVSVATDLKHLRDVVG